jgi:hypothetical protein
MRSSSVPKILGIILGAIIVGGLIGWLASRNPALPKPVVVEKPTARETPPVIAEPIIPAPANPVTNAAIVPVPSVSTNTPDEPETWEDKLDAILLSDADENKKGDDLLAMMPNVDEEAQTELAGHIVNLLDDAHFTNAAKYLTNAEVPEVVSSVFMNDLYNRENSLKLPLVLAVARNEKHPLHDEAKDLLELYIEEDHGTDWNAWETAMNTWLKENPDEEK